jgi:hypothetical protein
MKIYRQSFRSIVALMILLVALTSIACQRETSDRPSTSKQLASVEDAKRLAVGTWTCAEPGEAWLKLEINADGQYRGWEARPADDSWGTSSGGGRWEAGTGKYSDTGERYFCVRFPEGDFFVTRMFGAAVFEGPDVLVLRGEGGSYKFQRGDRNPFSK